MRTISEFYTSIRNVLSSALIGSAVLMANPVIADDILGKYKFNSGNGATVRDTAFKTGRKDGFEGRFPGTFSGQGAPFDRGNGEVVFEAGDSLDNVIMIDDSVSPIFNPGDDQMDWTVRLAIDENELEPDGTMISSKESWNVIQKGRFNQAGLWKMSIVPFKRDSGTLFDDKQLGLLADSRWDWSGQAENGDPVLSCAVQDERGRKGVDNTTVYATSDVPLEGGVVYNLRCDFNPTTGKFRAIVRDNRFREIKGPRYGITQTNIDTDVIGSINPGQRNSRCSGSDNRFGVTYNLLDYVSIGDKPRCADQTVAQDPGFSTDQFKGRILDVSIVKRN